MNRPEILQFLGQHHWVGSVEQLVGLGMTLDAIRMAKRRGALVAPARGVVALTGIELSFEGRALATQLAVGGNAFVSGPSAGVLHGLRSMPKARIEVTVSVSRGRVALPSYGRRVRSVWHDEARDVVVRDDGLRVASPLRMLFGLAAQFNQHRFERAAEDAWHRRLITPEAASDYLSAVRFSGRKGVLRMDTWLDKLSFRERPAQSGLELDFVDIIERGGLPAPKRQHPLVLASGETIHLDLAWPDALLAVEPGHSWWHGGDLGQRRDQQRDRACDQVGWRVIRYDEDARRHPSRTARELLAIYRTRIVQLRRF